MKKNWTKYNRASIKEELAKVKADDEFRKLFKTSGRVKFKRKLGGKIYTGTVHDCLCNPRRLYVCNEETGTSYWVDLFWLVKD